MDRVRFGTLGAARITPWALIRPARSTPAAEVVAVAARDRARADRFASRHDIPRVHATYADLIADPDVDAVYNPLPNGLHAEWTLRALDAGKHVLCEKPFTSNAAEAREVADAAEASGRVVVEAFHWRYHPLAARMIEIVASGELGHLRHLGARMCVPLPRRNDIRFQWALGGGAVMDTGCYTISLLRHLTGEEPGVTAARAWLRSDQIDRRMEAELAFPGGARGLATCSLWSRSLLNVTARVVGDDGELRVVNPVAPQFGHRLVVRAHGGRRAERFPRTPTYRYQLEAFCAAVLEGASVPTPPADAVANMDVVDAVYAAAGLRPRGT